MATRIEPASVEHFPEVHDRLLRSLNPRIPSHVWKRLFEQPLAPRDALLGQVLLDGERPVGYVAFIQVDVPFSDGDTRRVCNVSTWVVQPEYSQMAPALISPVLRMLDTTVTNLTNIATVHAIFLRLGFSELESGIRVMRPVPLTRSSWGFVEVEHRPEAIVPALSGSERAIAGDHAAYCHHILLREAGGRHCYAIFTLARRRRLRTARLHWVTPGVLADASIALRRALFEHHDAVLTEIDDRLAPRNLPGSFRVALPVPRLYRSRDVAGADLTNAYSEMTLLEL